MSASSEVNSRLTIVYFDPFGNTLQRNLNKLIHVGFGDGVDAYATPELTAEINTICKLGIVTAAVAYHTTNSAALPFISREKALICSKSLIASGQRPVSGEIVARGVSLNDEAIGLGDVYASGNPTSLSYAFTTEGNYPVTFGVDKRSLGKSHAELCDTSDGIRLGPKVPLSSVVSLITEHQYMPALTQWKLQNCPETTRVISMEAAIVLSSFHHLPRTAQ